MPISDDAFIALASGTPPAQAGPLSDESFISMASPPAQQQDTLNDWWAMEAGGKTYSELLDSGISDKRKKELRLHTTGLTNPARGFRDIYAGRVQETITDPDERAYIIENVRRRSILKEQLRAIEERDASLLGKAVTIAGEAIGGIAEGAARTQEAFFGPNRLLPGIEIPGVNLPIVGRRLPIIGGITLGRRGGGLGGRKYSKEDLKFLRDLEEAKTSENPFTPKGSGFLRRAPSGAGALASDIGLGGLAALSPGGAPALMFYSAMRHGAEATEASQELGLSPLAAVGAGVATAAVSGVIEGGLTVLPLGGVKEKALSPLARAGREMLIEFAQKFVPKTTSKVAGALKEAPKSREALRGFAEYIYRGAGEVTEEAGQAVWAESVKQAASIMSDNVDPRDPWDISREAVSAVKESALPVFIAGGAGPALSAISKKHIGAKELKEKVRKLTEQGSVSRREAKELGMRPKDSKTGKKYTPAERLAAIQEQAHDDALDDRAAWLHKDKGDGGAEITEEDARLMELPPEAGETSESRQAWLRAELAEAQKSQESPQPELNPLQSTQQPELNPLQSTQIDTGAPQGAVQQPGAPEVALEQQAAPEAPPTQDMNKAAGNEWLEKEGLSPTENPSVRPFVEAVKDAIVQKLPQRAGERAAEIVAEVNAGKQPKMNSDTQHAAFKVRSRQISQQLLDIRQRRNVLPEDAEAEGLNGAKLQERYDRLTTNENTLMLELDDLVRASRYSGTEVARALSIMKDREAQVRFDHEGYLNQLQKASMVPVSERERKAAADASGEYLEKESAVKNELEQDWVERDDATRKEAERVIRIAKKRMSKGRSLKEKAQIKRNDLIEQLRQRGVRARTGAGFLSNESGAADIETLRLIGKIGLTYVESGIGEVSVIVEKLKSDFPRLELTDPEIWESLIMQDPRQKSKDKTDAQKKEKNVKAIARQLIKTEKAYRGLLEEVGKRPPTSKRILVLQKEYAMLRNTLAKPGLDVTKTERALAKIDALQVILDVGQQQIKKEPDVVPSELLRLREEAGDLQSQINIRDELADIKRQHKTGDYRTTPRKIKRKISRKLEKAQIELSKQRAKMKRAIKAREPDIMFRKFRAVTAEMKAMAATADASFALRQNMWQMTAHPIRNFKPFFKSFKHILTENSALSLSNALENDARTDIRDMSGLKIMDPNSVGDQDRSEVFKGQWIENLKWTIPGTPIQKWQTPFGYVMTVSSRHAVAIGNLVRVAAFDAFMDLNPNATQIELKAMADYINKSTGLGDLSGIGRGAEVLNELMFSPKFVASRFQTPWAVVKYWNLPRVRKQIATDALRMVGTSTLLGFLAALAGLEVEWQDPESPDFLKVRFRDTRFFFGGGFLPNVRLGARLIIGTVKGLTPGVENEDNFNMWNLVSKWLSYKMAPGPAAIRELIEGQTPVGQKTTILETLGRAPVPILGQELIDAFKDSWAAFIVTGVMGGIGGDVATYQDSFSAAQRRQKNFHERGQHDKERSVRHEHNKGVKGEERKLGDLHRRR